MALIQDFRLQVKAYRESVGMTQQELAQQVGCSASRIAQVEAGYLPGAELAYELALACKLDPAEVVTWAVTERRAKPPEQVLAQRESLQVFAAMKRAQSRLWVCGITCIRRIRNVWESLPNLIEAWGQLRVLMLDPGCAAFRQRRHDEAGGDDEHLPRGRTTLRMDYEAHAVIEILKGLHHRAIQINPQRESVELRVYEEYPTDSIVVVDTVLVQLHEYRRKHMGKRPPTYLYWDPAHEGFRRGVTEFETRWDKARSVPLDDLAPRSRSLAIGTKWWE